MAKQALTNAQDPNAKVATAMQAAAGATVGQVRVNPSVSLINQLEAAIKELLQLGYDSIEGDMVGEMREMAKIAKDIGFSFLQQMIADCATASENYMRTGSEREAVVLTTAIARLQFALSQTNFGASNSAYTGSGTGSGSGSSGTDTGSGQGDANANVNNDDEGAGLNFDSADFDELLM